VRTKRKKREVECASCGEVPKNDCKESKRPCGHHCNHSWTHDECCWCGKSFDDEAARAPKKRGRPVGWRKESAFRSSMMVRLPGPLLEWLARFARQKKVSMSEVVRHLIILHKFKVERRRSK